jgi:hypothetical protein
LGAPHRKPPPTGAAADEPPPAAAPGRDDEEQRRRVLVLGRYGLLDTPPEPAFDRIASLARAVFDAPIALVSPVDENRHRRPLQGAELDQAVLLRT